MSEYSVEGTTSMLCCICVDKIIASGGNLIDASYAVTMVPIPQILETGGGMVAGIISVPCCFSCRKQQLKGTSKTGLVTK